MHIATLTDFSACFAPPITIDNLSIYAYGTYQKIKYIAYGVYVNARTGLIWTAFPSELAMDIIK